MYIKGEISHHLSRLGPRNVELHVGILLPVPKQEGELEQEAVVGIAECSESLRAGIAVEAAFKRLAGLYKVLPVLETVGISLLFTFQLAKCPRCVDLIQGVRRTTSALCFRTVAYSSSEPPKCPKSLILGSTA